MDSGSGILFLVVSISFAFFLFQIEISLSSTVQSPLEDQEKAFAPFNCSSDYDCQDLCHKGNFLYSRCDVNGTCICDCSDPSAINSSYTSACGERQPEGYWWDQCDTYCRQEYRRPCRYCTSDKLKFYCTCVCNYGSKLVDEKEQ